MDADSDVPNGPAERADPPAPPDPADPAHAATPSVRRRFFLWAERVVFAALLVFAAVRLGPQFGALLGVGPDLGSSPAYAFTALDGTSVDSDDLLGQVVVLNFWATWCGPCKLEMPSLQSLHEDRAEDGVVVLGLATDVGSGDAVVDFVEERGISYPIGRATRAHRAAFGGILGIPTTYLIDRRGIVRHKVVGYFAPPALRVAVGRLVDEDAAPSSASSAPSSAPSTSSAPSATGPAIADPASTPPSAGRASGR